MFSVQRYDVEGGSGSSSRSIVPDRVALINQRKASLQRPRSDTAEASSSKVTLSAPQVEIVSAQGSNGTQVAGQSDITAPAPTIHPSRLAVSQTLRQADRQAKVAASGGREKTKAKQRYLKTKKDRKKKRKAAEARKGKKNPSGTLDLGQDSDGGSDSNSDAEAVDGQKEVEEKIISNPKRQKLNIAETSETPAKLQSKVSFAPASSPETSSTPSLESTSAPSASASESEISSEGEAPSTTKKDVISAEAGTKIDEVIIPAQEQRAALSRFEAPRRTLQASRKDLAAQGLPSGLANPERIDPSITISVKKSDHAKLEQISTSMKSRLAKIGITEWFAVQTAVIPRLLSDPQSRSLYPDPPLADLCVSAPTGSGKTLSYAVPVVEILSPRICRRLRALVLLPTRELVDQVKDTFIQLIKGTPLSIAALTGQQSFQQEQIALVSVEAVRQKKRIPGVIYDEKNQNDTGPEEEISSMVDILITTPGRLIDHLDITPGFTLQHLRFLIIDEADRLLGQSFQEWLPRLLDALDPSKSTAGNKGVALKDERLAPAWLHRKVIKRSLSTYSGTMHLQETVPTGVQKLLFSATLTRDPAKILALQLRNTTFISVEMGDEQDAMGDTLMNGTFIDRQESFTLPATLREHMIVTKAAEKPLDLIHLLYNRQDRLKQVLCFTKSVENASRLVNLLNLYSESQLKGDRLIAREYSSDLNNTQRNQILKAFKAKEIDVLICSDVMARGMDLPDVQHVISYDVPIDMAKYVHRVGRTARANRQGDAWTLVEEQEARHFKNMMKKGGRKGNIEKVKIRAEERDMLREGYEEALARLEQLYSRA